MHKFSFAALVMLLSTSRVGAHVVLESPRPFKFVSDGSTNPVASTGSDFPCKIPPGAKLEPQGPPTIIAIGEDQKLSFSGQAVHGGGSCQLAVAEYPGAGASLKNVTWKVIHSIEGGCPARNQKGNLEGPNRETYIFHIPEGITPGPKIFSWTWLARVGGQPEYYMNCAPIEVVQGRTTKRESPSERRGRSLHSRRAADFPALFMANMGEASGGCTTAEALHAQIPIAFPDPGLSVDRPEGDRLFKQPCDGNPLARSPGGGGGARGTAGAGASSAPPIRTKVATGDGDGSSAAATSTGHSRSSTSTASTSRASS